jgi:sterol desaturase/sphingolipid hydroxylase (fatty acid hydroxylase superfamily)
MDLTVAATPFYFGSMAVERRVLARRARREGPQPSDYERSDTMASLTMGTASLVAPFAAGALVRLVAPGSGRFPKVLVRTAVGAAVITTVADRLATLDRRAADHARVEPTSAAGLTATHSDAPPTLAALVPTESAPGPRAARRRRVAAWARKLARVGGPVTIAAGALAASTGAAVHNRPAAMWKRNGGRDLGEGVAAWAVAIIGWDLIYYWNHRLMHEVRALWAIHVVHHSSERYNLSTALRQPVADVLGVFVPQGLMCRLGVRPRLVEQARGVNLLYQYWVHTDAIRKIGPAEEALNSPSHHRVHHGSNSRYIDRNHGGILIIWDRLFGTFQRERADDPVIYGLTKNINTFNPLRIATHEYADIVRDVSRSTTWHDRLSYVLRGPGWAYARR